MKDAAMRLAALLAVVLVASAAAGSALAGHAATGPCASGNVVKTASYDFALTLGPRQEMYLPSEVRERKLKTGQVMLGGEMAMIDPVPAGMRIYDLQVHVCTKSGAVVTQLKPKIVVKQAGVKTAANLPVAIMAAVAKGLKDYHYGNDVALKPGGKVTVTVTVKGQKAVLRATVPGKGAGSGSGHGHSMG
jgi:hypothetical protein